MLLCDAGDYSLISSLLSSLFLVCLNLLSRVILFLNRPLSEDEIRLRTPTVISCNENRREVCAAQNIANKQIDRTFNFDKVCSIFTCLVVCFNEKEKWIARI